MEAPENPIEIVESPSGLAAPVPVEESTEHINLWRGVAELNQASGNQSGEACVIFDTLPRPRVRFEFRPTLEGDAPRGVSAFRRLFDGGRLTEGELRCGFPVGNLSIDVTATSGDDVSGIVRGWAKEPVTAFAHGKMLVVNGPSAHGTIIKRGSSSFTGRLQCATADVTVTVDRISADKPSSRTLYGFTHVAEIRFKEPQPVKRFEEVAADLFRTLSLMRGRWVGLVGPWLFVDDTLTTVATQVTKVSPYGSSPTWHHDTVMGTFEELFQCVQNAYQDSERRESLQTGLHWLIESQLCAGGVEGSLVLQQAAMEAIAWFEIVQSRKLCSHNEFDKVAASEKIRRLLVLHAIPMSIPAHYGEVRNYANDHKLDDLPAVLVHIRRALIHGSPKNVERLFARQRGERERIDVWYLIGGLLEQIVLAIVGYRGKIMRRDLDVEFAVSAIKQVPWA